MVHICYGLITVGLDLSEKEMMDKLLNKGKLALEPGSKYGEAGRGFLRMNVATPLSLFEDGVKRFITALTVSRILLVDVVAFDIILNKRKTASSILRMLFFFCFTAFTQNAFFKFFCFCSCFFELCRIHLKAKNNKNHENYKRNCSWNIF